MIIEFGTPKQWMMSVKNWTASSDRIFAMGLVSIHLVNLSTATRRCVKPPSAFFKGLTRSNPQTAKGQVTGMV